MTRRPFGLLDLLATLLVSAGVVFVFTSFLLGVVLVLCGVGLALLPFWNRRSQRR
jgi:hypothetical protein